jgi:hypothetical protein
MNLEKAIELVNDASLVAYCDYVQHQVFRVYGEYEPGLDATYDEVAYAWAYVAVEDAFADEPVEYVPDDPPSAEQQES